MKAQIVDHCNLGPIIQIFLDFQKGEIDAKILAMQIESEKKDVLLRNAHDQSVTASVAFTKTLLD